MQRIEASKVALYIRFLFMVSLLLIYSGSASWGQVFRASINGEVADPSGAVIPGATVTAVSVATKQSFSTQTNSQGEYALLDLSPGAYTVTVTAPHYKTKVYNDLELASAEQRGLNVALSLGAVNQSVTVTATSGLLNTVTASTGSVLNESAVQNMPSTGRQVWDDVSVTQGVRSQATDPFDLTLRNNGNAYTVSGVPSNGNAFFVNGAPVSDQGNWYYAPEQDAVQEVQVSVAPYDARYGRTAGGAFNSNVKAGTDKYHGSIYDYYGNEALNANFSANNLAGIKKGLNIRNTYGGTLGGPIRSRKTFFFGGFEGYRQNYPAPSIQSVPPLSWRSGDFSGSGYTIYDPLSTHCLTTNATGGCTQYGRTPFPNDTIPASRISPIGQALLALYPAQTAPGDVNNYAITGARSFYYDQYLSRIDQAFTDKTRMYGLFTLQKGGAFFAGNGFTNAASTQSVPISWDYNIITDLTHIFSPSLVMDLKASYGHDTNATFTGTALQNSFLASKLGLTMPHNGSALKQNIAPEITTDNYAALFGNTDSGTFDGDANFAGNMTQIIGHHTLYYGAEAMDVQYASIGTPGIPNGTFHFDPTWSQNNPFQANPSQGNSIADILLGAPTTGSATWDENIFETYHYYGLYVQDNYMLRPNLVLNLGLRWDVNQSPSERHNRMNAGFCLTCTNPYTSQINYSIAPTLQNPLLGGLLFAGVGGVSRAPYLVQKNNWQPRIGVSWAIMPKVVIRGGYGIYDSWPYLNITSQGFSETTSYISSVDGNLTPTSYFSSGTPYPSGLVAPAEATGGLETDAGQNISYYNTDRRIPMAQHWSFGMQWEPLRSTVLDVEYMGTATHNLPVSTSLGIIPPALQQSCNQDLAICNTTVPNPFRGVLPANTPLGSSAVIPAWELQRAYPLFNGVYEVQAPTGSSHYNALSVRVQRQLRSLNFIFNYTYSNWMDRDGYLNNGAFRDTNLYSDLDPADVRHYMDLNVVYPLPTTKERGVIGALANNWLVDSTVMWGSGTPLSIISANLTGTPGCTSYIPQGGQTRAHWFNNNVNCYQELGPWQARTSPLQIGYLRNPGAFFWNPAVHKQFGLSHGMFLRFRAEAVNGANHPVFGGPNESLNEAPTFSPRTNWAGFGTLPIGQSNAPRALITSLRIIF